ncbi:MAG: hypothetical protein V7K69_25565 [Nostoc sp.]
MGAERQELGLNSGCNLEFLLISRPPSHSDRILSDIIESSPS